MIEIKQKVGERILEIQGELDAHSAWEKALSEPGAKKIVEEIDSEIARIQSKYMDLNPADKEICKNLSSLQGREAELFTLKNGFAFHTEQKKTLALELEKLILLKKEDVIPVPSGSRIVSQNINPEDKQ